VRGRGVALQFATHVGYCFPTRLRVYRVAGSLGTALVLPLSAYQHYAIHLVCRA